MTDGTWRCPKCRWEITVAGSHITLSNAKVDDKQKTKRAPLIHADCELRKPLSQIDFTKLVLVPE